MFNLIKNNIIQFDKLIIREYSSLNLDEADTIILIRLNDLLQKGERFLSLNAIASSMRLNEAECGQKIVDLVKRGFITLELSEAREVFSLDETYRRLGYLLEAADEKNASLEINEQIKNTIKMLEKELNKTLSPIELEIVSRWYIEKRYTNEQIEAAIFKAFQNNNKSIAYIDRLMAKDTSAPAKKKTEGAERIQDLFRKVYAKGKRNP